MKILFSLLFLLCSVQTSFAAPPMESLANAGFRTIGIWQPEQQLRLDINVWYPTSRRPTELNYSPWTIQAASKASPREGKFPIILLSHATAGTRFSYHELAANLGRRGFVVAAPTHVGDNMDDMAAIFTLEQLINRVAHLQVTLNALLHDAILAPVLNSTRVGVLGFRAGGTAALLMGGGQLDPAGWKGYCNENNDDLYCSAWAESRMNRMADSLPLKRTLHDPRILAVAAVSPIYGMMLTPTALRDCSAEIFLVETKEDLQPNSANKLLADRFPQIAGLVRLPKADTGGLMSSCPRALEEELPELCNSVTPEQRQQSLRQVSEALGTFFAQTLQQE